MMRPLTTLLWILLLCAGCSGGGSSDSEGGIGGSGITRGAITGTGSAVVAGTDFETDMATGVIDRITQPDDGTLALGMTARVEGTRSGNGSTGVAERVEVDDAIEGPVSAIAAVPMDMRERDLTILDQTVRIRQGATVFAGTDFDMVGIGDVVEVFGFRDGSDRIVATRLEHVTDLGSDPTPPVELKGVVANLDTAGFPDTFTIGAVTIEFDAATTDLPDGVPTNGDFVEVEGTLDGASTVDATSASDRIEEEGPDTGDLPDYQIEGIVSDFAGREDFRVDGQPVDASSLGILFEPPILFGSDGFLEDGVRVEVEGRLEGGVVLPTAVRLRDGEVFLAAEIAPGAIDAGATTITLLGSIEVLFDTATRFDDDDDEGDGECSSFADLAAGSFVQIEGVQTGASRVLATEVECETDDDEDVEVQGRVQSSDGTSGSFTILGLVIDTDALTGFEGFPDPPGVDDEADFYAFLIANPGALLEVTDEADGDATTLDVADEVELSEDDEDDDD